MRTELTIEGQEYRLTLYPQTQAEKAILALFAEREDIRTEMIMTQRSPYGFGDPEVNHFTLSFHGKREPPTITGDITQ